MANKKKQPEFLVTMPRGMTAESAQKDLYQLYEEKDRLEGRLYETQVKIKMAFERCVAFRNIKAAMEQLRAAGLTPEQLRKAEANMVAEYPEPELES